MLIWLLYGIIALYVSSFDDMVFTREIISHYQKAKSTSAQTSVLNSKISDIVLTNFLFFFSFSLIMEWESCAGWVADCEAL